MSQWRVGVLSALAVGALVTSGCSASDATQAARGQSTAASAEVSPSPTTDPLAGPNPALEVAVAAKGFKVLPGSSRFDNGWYLDIAIDCPDGTEHPHTLRSEFDPHGDLDVVAVTMTSFTLGSATPTTRRLVEPPDPAEAAAQGFCG